MEIQYIHIIFELYFMLFPEKKLFKEGITSAALTLFFFLSHISYLSDTVSPL